MFEWKRSIEWIPTPRWVFGSFVGITIATFVGGVIFEPTRWNILTTGWGVMGAGIVVWWILEQYSEVVQQRSWLRRHGLDLAPVIQVMLDAAFETAGFSLRLPEELKYELRHGKTRESRRRAEKRALEMVDDIANGRTVELRDYAKKSCTRANDVDRWWRTVSEMAMEHDSMLYRLTALQSAIKRYEFLCVEFLRTCSTPIQPQDVADERVRDRLSMMGWAAVLLCRSCSDVLHEAGILP